MPPDIHTLTGAYALHALPEDERALFEAHLDDCDACAQEVRELQATAAEIGLLVHEPPPPGMRARVLAAIDETRQLPPAAEAPTPPSLVRAPSGRAASRRAWSWPQRLVGVAAAVATIAVVALSVVVADLNARVAQMEAPVAVGTGPAVQSTMVAAEVEDLLRAEDLAMVNLDDGPAVVRVVMSPARGEAVLLVSGMEPAPSEHAYTLWLHHTDGQVTPAGLLELAEDGEAAHYLSADMTAVTALGVTVEPDPGLSGSDVSQPSDDPVMVVELAG